MWKKRLRAGIVLAVFTAPLALHSQEQPLAATGTFSTGYYSTYMRGEANQQLKFVPVGARFDINGYYLSPDLLSFSAQPELSVGPQASEAGFQGGNGVRLSLTLLRKRIFPLTFRYSNVQFEDVYFGSLSQVSGYTLQNRNKDLGVNWEFRPGGLPVTTVDWGLGSVDSKSGIANVSDYLSHGSHLNVDTKYERWGWDLEGFMHHQQQQSDLLVPLGVGTETGSLLQTVTQFQGAARHGFFEDSELYLEGGRQSTSSLLLDLPIDLTTHYVSANLRLRQRRRWKTSLRAGYSSNLASQLLAQAAGSFTGTGTVAPDGNFLLPFSHGISNLNLNGITTLSLSRSWGLTGSVERSAVLSSGANGPLNASYLTASAGVTYAGKFRWGNLSGQYARDFGLGSITGQSGTIQGDNYQVTAQHGVPGQLQFDGMVHGSDQTIDNAQPVSNRSFAVEGSAAHSVAGGFSVRLGGGWQRSAFVNAANEFRSAGFTARAGIEHPRVQINASLNSTLSNSLPFYSQILGGLGVGSVLVTPLQIIPSDYRAMTFSVHSIPLRKVEVSAFWTRSNQHLDGLLNNNFQLLNVFVTYHFRRIQLEAGLIRSNQIFLNYPDTQRERFYIRVSRTARLL